MLICGFGEMVDALDLKSDGQNVRAGSTPAFRTHWHFFSDTAMF